MVLVRTRIPGAPPTHRAHGRRLSLSAPRAPRTQLPREEMKQDLVSFALCYRCPARADELDRPRMRRADGAEPGPECEVILEGAMSRCDPRVGEEWVQAHSPSRPAPVYDRVASDLHAGAGFPPAPMLPLQTPHVCLSTHSTPLKRRPLYHTSLLPHNT